MPVKLASDTRPRIPYLDLLRIAAICVVMILHIAYRGKNETDVRTLLWTGKNFFNGFSRWGVGVLVMVSGALFLDRDIPLKKIIPIFRDGFRTVANVMFLIAASGAFGWMLAYLRVPRMVSDAILSVSSGRYGVLFLLNVILLLLGMICDMGPAILIATPVLLPVAQSVGIDPIHFGIIMMLNLGIGLTTPPVGAALFAVCSVGKAGLGKVVRATLPMYLVMIVVLVIVNLFPEITLFLPRLLFG